MLRITKLFAALLVISLVIFTAQVGFNAPGGKLKLEGGSSGGLPDICSVVVKGIEKRSGCDFQEWWVEGTNSSSVQWYRVSVHARVKASVGPSPLCEVERNVEWELGPGQCNFVSGPFYNDPNRPCDPQCCVINDPDDSDCLECTTILDAKIKVTAWKESVHSAWQTLDPPLTICAMTNGAVDAGSCEKCEVINTCELHDWSLTTCQPGNPE